MFGVAKEFDPTYSLKNLLKNHLGFKYFQKIPRLF